MRIHVAAILQLTAALLLLGSCWLAACEEAPAPPTNTFVLRPLVASPTARKNLMQVSNPRPAVLPLPAQSRRAAPTTKAELQDLVRACRDTAGWDGQEPYSAECEELRDADTSAVEDMSELFVNSDFNGDISKWNVAAVTDMSLMFAGAAAFDGDISKWNVAKVENLVGIFFGASSLVTPVAGWRVTLSALQHLRSGCLPGIGEAACTAVELADVSQITDMSRLFAGFPTNLDLSKWNVAAVTNMEAMFAQSRISGDFSEWNVAAVTNMAAMFQSNSAFDGDISKWNVAKVTNMQYIFYGASSLVTPVAGWRVTHSALVDLRSGCGWSGDEAACTAVELADVSEITDMSGLFALFPTNLDLSKWNVAAVTDMSFMFAGAAAFDGDISKWNVAKVTSMNGMFYQARDFNQNIGGWDVSAVKQMDDMFFEATAFVQDLCCWDASSLESGADQLAKFKEEDCECINTATRSGCPQGRTASPGAGAGAGDATCTCWPGFADVHGNGTVCKDIDECRLEEKAMQCHSQAECDNTYGSFACVCPEGFVGDGTVCSGSAWAVRSVFAIPEVSSNRRALGAGDLELLKLQYARLVSNDGGFFANASIVTGMPFAYGALNYGVGLLEIEASQSNGQITLMALFEEKADAETAVAALASVDSATYWLFLGSAREIVDGPEVYRWVAQTTSAPQEINPSGLEVDSVYFEPTCMSSGCWKVHITYTARTDNMNVIYIPKAVGDDSQSYDFDYDVNDPTWDVSPEDTFVANQHPCSGTLDYDPSAGTLPASVTSCCIPQFTDMYRPVSTFVDALDAVTGLSDAFDTACAPVASGNRNRAVNRNMVPIIAKRGQTVDISEQVFPRPDAPEVPGLGADIFSDGVFAGMTESRINHTQVVDQYIGIYRAVLSLDEVELRRMAGQLRGTVGVEHTVDTFIGKAEFSMTGIPFLDPFATQVDIHLEKTNFFSVSTHGVNAYTFLEYVNMRLVSILTEDRDFSGVSTGTSASGDANGDDESAIRTLRTNATGNVNYVQVTFTLGSQYGVNNNPNDDKFESGLIPLNSVRVGRGTFFDRTPMEHVCKEYEEAEDDDDDEQPVGLTVGRVAKSAFDDTVAQPCGPQASMCASPSSVPDQFVSFNIPLGSEVFDGQASNALSNNIFVDFVVNALDLTATGTPNNGDDPLQMKTTLTASIPIVAGGVNIFCDGITAKTDLKDVANADIIVGTASGAEELTRLRIIENVASTDLSAVDSVQIDTPSIESALMTLVLHGTESYFATGASQTGGYSLELDDLITLHLMEDGEAGTVVGGMASNSKEAGLIALLNEPADDNSDSNGLDTDGYKLNGAFRFDIARSDGIAKLEPTPELLAICPFNPARPVAGNSELETCITRRDVRSRTYPARTGAPFPTAMEIFNSGVMGGGVVSSFDVDVELDAMSDQVATAGEDPCQGGDSDYSKATFADSAYACEAGFMTSILGDSVYARQLAKDFVSAIRTRYDLNGRYTRAFWINPGYEWTPTQTAGKSLFQVSQKVYLFALITLDENWGRRRMLLQADPTAASGSGAAGAKLEVAVTPRSMLASSFEVPEDKVAVFEVELQLTRAEACASTVELQSSIRDTMEDYLSSTASSFLTAQITRMTVDKGGEECGGRRALRKLLAEWSSATAKVQLMVVFAKGKEAKFNEKKFTEMAGVNAITAGANTKVTIDDKFDCDDCSPGASSAAKGSSDSDNSNMALIAGVCGGVGGAVLVGAAAMLWMRSRNRDYVDSVMAPPVTTINVDDLKAQLQDPV